MKKFLAATLATGAMLLAAPSVIAQQVITAEGYTQNFNSIGSGLPSSWSVNTSATSSSLGTSLGLTNTATTSWADTGGRYKNLSSANIASTSNATAQGNNTDRALGIRQSGTVGDPGASFNLNFSTINFDLSSLSIDLMQLTNGSEANSRENTWSLQYGIGAAPTSFTTLDTFTLGGATSVWRSEAFAFDLNTHAGDFAAMSDQSSVWFRVVALTASSGSGTRMTFAIDNFSLTAENSGPPTTGNYWSEDLGGGGTGTWSSAGPNWATGADGDGRGVTQGTGTLEFGNTAGTVTVDGGVTVNSGMRFSTTGYTIESSTISLAGGSSAANTVTTETGVSATINSQLTGSSGMTKAGAGELVLGGANTYTGTTEVSAGTLALAESGSLASSVALASGTTFDLTAKPTGYALASGTTLSGTGTVTTAADQTLSVGSGATIQPATATTSGILTLDGLTFAGGGTYDFSIGNVSGTAGTAWDLISVNNNFDITAASGNEFVISIAGNSGVPTGFSNLSNYSWEILGLGSGEIVGFDPDAFGFVNNLLRSNGTFSVTSDGSSLTLNYAAGTALSVAYQGANGGAWTGAGNWAGGFIPNTDEIAQFGATPTQVNATVGLNMNTAGGAINVGAIEVTAAREQNLTLSNSTGVVSGTLTMVGVEVNGTENVVLRNASGSLLTLANGTSQAMDVAFANATENKIVIDGAGGITVASAIISADAGVTLTGSGSGALTLAGVNTYTGPTSVINGRLNISGSVTSDVTIGTGATLAGKGTIDGNLSFESGANFVFDLTGPLTVNDGNVSFGGFSLSNLVGLTSDVDLGRYILISGTADFDFANVSDFGEVNKVDIGGGKFAYLDSGSFAVEVIPEPSTYALLTLSGLALAGYAARRRNRQK